ncbi:MAG TPA: cytochrome oxidase small assembly protein [Paucimonas sp.]|nr:cytochrome oxidase small assembly protein [Paucimonas sp.]
MSEPNKPNNVKTALILATIALIFFIGVFAKRLWLG